jgi:TubC N-terminal docking domain
MNTAEFLIDLRAKGIALWSENDTLHYRGPKGAVTAEIRSQLAERKIENPGSS